MAYVSNWLSQVWGGGQGASAGSPPASNATQMELSCPSYKIEAGLDYMGGDIGTGPTVVKGDVACCMLCESTTACNAFTFVLATSECWLKVRRRGPRHESQPGALVSGYRPQLKRGTRALTRFGGGTLAGRPLVGQRRGAVAAAGGGAGGRAAAGRWQQERQAGLLLQRAAPHLNAATLAAKVMPTLEALEKDEDMDVLGAAREALEVCLALIHSHGS